MQTQVLLFQPQLATEGVVLTWHGMGILEGEKQQSYNAAPGHFPSQ